MLLPHASTADHWRSDWIPAGDAVRSRLERAVIETVAYADVFDYPLTPAEIHRYLTGLKIARGVVDAALQDAEFGRPHLERRGRFVCLAGRRDLVERRQQRENIAAHLWPRAKRYAAIIARLPFVRLVAVSGALAVDNVEPDDDIDYFVVTECERLWVCRAMVVALVRAAERVGDRLCPNYFLSDRALVLRERNLFTARELAQLVPLAGFRTYRRLRRLNAWSADFLPNAQEAPRPLPLFDQGVGRARRLAERIGRARPGGWLDAWEMRRKMRRFGVRAREHEEAQFGPDVCKGHFDRHGRRALDAFTNRLRALDLL